MIVETPIEILHLPAKLHEMFDGQLRGRKSGDATERDRNFLSRILGAYAVHKLAGAPTDAAGKRVVNGGGDGGIDAIYFSPGDKKRSGWVTDTFEMIYGLFFLK